MGGIMLSPDPATNPVFIQVEQELVHPDYAFDATGQGDEQNDIMLVKLTEPAPVGMMNVGLVTLNFNSAVPADGQVVTVMGYGRTSEDGQNSDVLLQAELDTVGSVECEMIWGDALQPAIMVCAGVPDGSRDSCQVQLITIF
jgi:hypothetical protein